MEVNNDNIRIIIRDEIRRAFQAYVNSLVQILNLTGEPVNLIDRSEETGNIKFELVSCLNTDEIFICAEDICDFAYKNELANKAHPNEAAIRKVSTKNYFYWFFFPVFCA